MSAMDQEQRQRTIPKAERLEEIRQRVQAYVNRGGDLRSKEAAPLGLEFLEAFNDFAKVRLRNPEAD